MEMDEELRHPGTHTRPLPHGSPHACISQDGLSGHVPVRASRRARTLATPTRCLARISAFMSPGPRTVIDVTETVASSATAMTRRGRLTTSYQAPCASRFACSPSAYDLRPATRALAPHCNTHAVPCVCAPWTPCMSSCSSHLPSPRLVLCVGKAPTGAHDIVP